MDIKIKNTVDSAYLEKLVPGDLSQLIGSTGFKEFTSNEIKYLIRTNSNTLLKIEL